jgi:uncharacterized protein (DUF427 family)
VYVENLLNREIVFYKRGVEMKAVWNNIVLAESDKAIKIEDDYFFPVDSIHMEHLKKISKQGYCKLKGNICYYDIIANGKTLAEAAMSYDNPAQEAAQIRNFVSFIKEVEIKE